MHTNGSVEPTVVSDGFLLNVALSRGRVNPCEWMSCDRAFGHDLGQAVPLLARSQNPPTGKTKQRKPTSQPTTMLISPSLRFLFVALLAASTTVLADVEQDKAGEAEMTASLLRGGRRHERQLDVVAVFPKPTKFCPIVDCTDPCDPSPCDIGQACIARPGKPLVKGCPGTACGVVDRCL
jgi:hypothetical protein